MATVQILLFANLREQLGEENLRLSLAGAATAAHVRDLLIESRGERWQEILGAENILVAVNQELVDWHCAVVDGDEVAFFPPVTGG